MEGAILTRLEARITQLIDLELYREVGTVEASEILGVSEETIRHRCRNYELPFLAERGRPYRFLKRDLLSWKRSATIRKEEKSHGFMSFAESEVAS